MRRTIPQPSAKGVGHRVEQVWVALAEQGPENESVVGVSTPGGLSLPMFTVTPLTLPRYTEMASDCAHAIGKRVRLAAFSHRVDLETFEP